MSVETCVEPRLDAVLTLRSRRWRLAPAIADWCSYRPVDAVRYAHTGTCMPTREPGRDVEGARAIRAQPSDHTHLPPSMIALVHYWS